MGTDVIKSYDYLQEELERAKNNLKGLNDNIRRIVGRDPQEINLRGDRKRGFNDSKRNDSERQRVREPSPNPIKKRNEAKSVFSRLSGPIRDEDAKPRMHSRVIRELPTRQEIVAAQGTDEESRARNRRMFGCLMGTLQKFCQEESRLKPKEDKKAQIEKKLEEQQIQEKEDLKKERQTLFTDRKKQQLQIRMLEMKMIRLKEFEVWEKSKRDLNNFMKTKSKPCIYFISKVMNEKTEKRLSECRAELEIEIEKKRKELNAEILDIENHFKMREEGEDVKGSRTFIAKQVRKNQNFTENENDSAYERSDEENYERQEEAESNTDLRNHKNSKENGSKNSIERSLSSVVVNQKYNLNKKYE